MPDVGVEGRNAGIDDLRLMIVELPGVLVLDCRVGVRLEGAKASLNGAQSLVVLQLAAEHDSAITYAPIRAAPKVGQGRERRAARAEQRDAL